jgi:hypothetical protein
VTALAELEPWQVELEVAAMEHGTYAGAQRHRKLGHRPCPACLAGAAEYVRMWRRLKPQHGPRCRCRPCLADRAQRRAARAAERAAARDAAMAARPAHGYGPYTRGCRCRVCKDAKAAYCRNRRAAARVGAAA